jgi:hypothetical protein
MSMLGHFFMKIEMPQYLTDIQEEVLIGTMLGDACIYLPNKNRNRNPYLSIKRMIKDKKYLEWQASFFTEFTKRPVHETTYMTGNPGQKYKYTAIEYVSRCASALLPYRLKWYPEDKKIVPRDLKLTPLILMEWFCDDGFVVIRKKGNSVTLSLVLCTMGFTYDDVEFLKNLLEIRYNEKFYITKKNTISCSSVAATLIIKEIDNILPPGMERKATWRQSEVNFYNRDFGQSRFKKQEELKLKIKEFLEINKTFTILELAKYTNCISIHHGKLEPMYDKIYKYLEPYKIKNIGKYNWKNYV